MSVLGSSNLVKIRGDDVFDSERGFSESLSYYADITPQKKAVYCAVGLDSEKRSTYASYSFFQLRKAADKYTAGLTVLRVTAGMRVLVLAKPSLDFAALFFSLNEIGAVPVIIDPGMGVSAMLKCVERASPEVMIGEPKAYVLTRLFWKKFKSVSINIITQHSYLMPGATTLAELRELGRSEVDVSGLGSSGKNSELSGEDIGAILFTSGSTGTPKGVELKRRHISAQKNAWNTTFTLDDTDVDLVTFPIFLLVSISSGRTCVLPDIDFSRPGTADPARIFQAIEDHSPTFCFASPVLWNNLSKYAYLNSHKLNSLKKIVSGGAPVPFSVLSRLANVSPGAEVFTPYGSTEALPISSITFDEINSDTQKLSEQGYGTCVGRPLEGVELHVIKDCDASIYSWSKELILPCYEIGEIVVRGAVVTESYNADANATEEAKIYEQYDAYNQANKFCWHRMGDLGYLDEKGRLWFCGRKAHKVTIGESIYYSVKVEGIFNALKSVWRTALVPVLHKTSGTTQLALAVELEPEEQENFFFVKPKLEALSKTHRIPIEHFIFHRKPFPVDRRHNAKIERGKIAIWVQNQI